MFFCINLQRNTAARTHMFKLTVVTWAIAVDASDPRMLASRSIFLLFVLQSLLQHPDPLLQARYLVLHVVGAWQQRLGRLACHDGEKILAQTAITRSHTCEDPTTSWNTLERFGITRNPARTCSQLGCNWTRWYQRD